MREILFRGKKTNKDKWIYGVPVKGTEYDESEILMIESVFACDEYACRGCDFEPVIPSTVGQYTGMIDKNGKKIFEGDIVKCKHEWQNQGRTMDTDEVAFLEQKIRGAYGKYIDKSLGEIFRWRFHYFRNYAVEYYALNGGLRVRNGSCFHSLTQTYITNRDLEVIGNIHDNPELLKGGEG